MYLKKVFFEKMLYRIIFYSKSLHYKSTFKIMKMLKGRKLRAPKN